MTEAQGSETPLSRFLTRISETHAYMNKPEIDVHGYVLKRGRRFASQPLTQQEKEYIDSCDWTNHQKKQCYMNAQMTAIVMAPRKDMTLLYTEGFLGMGDMEYGIHHAWLSLNGKLVDTTLRTKPDDQRVMGIIPEGYEYYGVEMDPEQCFHSVGHKAWTPVIDDWECGWPFLTKDESWIKETKEAIQEKFNTENKRK